MCAYAQERRLWSLHQLLNVIRPNGLLLVYVWAQEQEKSASKGRKKKAACSGGANEVASSRAQRASFEKQDVLVPWQFAEPGKKSGGERKRSAEEGESRVDTDHGANCEATTSQSGVFHRYYHVFHKTELRELCELVADRASIDEYYHDRGNWCVILRKHSTSI